MKRITLPLLALPLFVVVAATGAVAAADPIVSILTDFPGGNLRVISNDGTTVEVAPDLRGGRDWFYWCFEATASKPGTVTFRFPEKVAGFHRGAVGFQGPAVSKDSGQTWRWRGSNSDFSSADEFSWDFTAGEPTMRFAVTIPYTRSDFTRFVEQHRDNPHLLVKVLTRTRLDRDVPLLQVGHPGDGRRAMLITCRHHACETIASFLLEGILATAISDSDEGRAFRKKYVLYAVPLVDIDGVEAGDQGKNRPPHDHNRDYGEASIYRSVQAIKVLGVENNIRFLLDLHCPTLVMDIHQRFYFAGPGDMPLRNEAVVKQFASLIKSELPGGAPHGPVLQLKSGDKNRHKHCSGYFSKLPGMLMAVTLETPFAPGKTKMSPDAVRNYGAALLRAWNQLKVPSINTGTGMEAPYPPSPVISGISLDWTTHRRAAQGSDNFQLTWADDDHQYGWWGDGGGFGGTNSVGRVGLGFARVEGSDDDWKGFNVWGGTNAEHKARFTGKSWGTICVDGALYSWIVPDVPDSGGNRDHYRYIELARSTDHGASWTRADWRWRLDDDLIVPTFLNFGRNNTDARDEFVYAYFIRPQTKRITQDTFGLEVHKPGGIFLARVRPDRIFAGRAHYEWFAGMNDHEPRWGPHAQKQVVFEDPNGTGWCLSAVYDPGLKRYLLCTEHENSHSSLIGLFDAPDPWGPWTTVKYWTPGEHFGQHRPGSDLDWRPNVFFVAFTPKWFASDGISFTMNFTGGGSGKDNDSFNTVQGRFHINPLEE